MSRLGRGSGRSTQHFPSKHQRDVGLRNCDPLQPRCVAKRATTNLFGSSYLRGRGLDVCCAEAQG